MSAISFLSGIGKTTPAITSGHELALNASGIVGGALAAGGAAAVITPDIEKLAGGDVAVGVMALGSVAGLAGMVATGNRAGISGAFGGAGAGILVGGAIGRLGG